MQFKEFYKVFIINRKEDSQEDKMCLELKMYQLIVENNLQDVFPNIFTLLKIYLVLMTTNCTDERGFSKLKLIKSRLRSSMTQDRLNNLSLMSFESDLLKKINYNEIINDFAEKKCKVFL